MPALNPVPVELLPLQPIASTVLAPDGRTGTATVTATLPGAAAATATVTIGAGLAVQLAVVPSRLPANSAATVDVLVVGADGSPAPTGTEVRVQTTRGRLDVDRLRTDGAGRATTILRGDGSTGTATVTATVAGSSASATQVVTFT